MLAVFLDSLLSCLSLFKGSVLRWHPAGVVHATCMRDEPIPLASEVVRERLAGGSVSVSQCEYGKSIYINGEACFCHYN